MFYYLFPQYGVIQGTYLALEFMSPDRGGVVINMGSMAGQSFIITHVHFVLT